MATLTGKNKFSLPQLIVFTDVEPVQDEDGYWNIYDDELTNYLVLSDHNRSSLDVSKTRIEKRERMINGRMRSYHIADKDTLTVSWDMLPSRSYESYSDTARGLMFTADSGAGGADLLDWYNNHEGMFYVLLAYDLVLSDSGTLVKTASQFYERMLPVMFSDFSYSVVKRGQTTHDFWNISLSLEEV
jgi:hypothetical protein